MKKIDYSELNPGIRETVRFLREYGFETTDSGDGVTNVEAGMEGAVPYPHVHMQISDVNMRRDAHRLANALITNGFQPEPGMIQMTYDPMLPQATMLSLSGVDDELLERFGVFRAVHG